LPLVNNQEAKIQPENTSESKAVTKNHKIRKGESLFTIAKQYNMSVDKLKELNRLKDTKLQQGQVLIVSQTDSRSEKLKDTPVKIHKVKSGESFYSIAKTYGCTVSELKSLNGLAENKLNLGDKLKVNDRN
jgi:LysM repeat protein